MRQADLALKRFEKAAAQQAKEQLIGGEKKRHVTPHVGLQGAKSRNDPTSVPKRRGNFGNVAKRRLVPLISKQFEVPRQKCFD